jgi:transposase-like protein
MTARIKSTRPKNGTGRPSKFNPETAQKIISAIRDGNYMETAAAYAGLSKDTFYDWLKQGAAKDAKPEYKAFSDSIAIALAEAEVLDLETIGTASRSQWQAAAWRLERRNHERWGRADRMNVNHSGSIDFAGQFAAAMERATSGSRSED